MNVLSTVALTSTIQINDYKKMIDGFIGKNNHLIDYNVFPVNVFYDKTTTVDQYLLVNSEEKLGKIYDDKYRFIVFSYRINKNFRKTLFSFVENKKKEIEEFYNNNVDLFSIDIDNPLVKAAQKLYRHLSRFFKNRRLSFKNDEKAYFFRYVSKANYLKNYLNTLDKKSKYKDFISLCSEYLKSISICSNFYPGPINRSKLAAIYLTFEKGKNILGITYIVQNDSENIKTKVENKDEKDFIEALVDDDAQDSCANYSVIKKICGSIKFQQNTYPLLFSIFDFEYGGLLEKPTDNQVFKNVFIKFDFEVSDIELIKNSRNINKILENLRQIYNIISLYSINFTDCSLLKIHDFVKMNCLEKPITFFSVNNYSREDVKSSFFNHLSETGASNMFINAERSAITVIPYLPFLLNECFFGDENNNKPTYYLHKVFNHLFTYQIENIYQAIVSATILKSMFLVRKSIIENIDVRRIIDSKSLVTRSKMITRLLCEYDDLKNIYSQGSFSRKIDKISLINLIEAKDDWEILDSKLSDFWQENNIYNSFMYPALQVSMAVMSFITSLTSGSFALYLIVSSNNTSDSSNNVFVNLKSEGADWIVYLILFLTAVSFGLAIIFILRFFKKAKK